MFFFLEGEFASDGVNFPGSRLGAVREIGDQVRQVLIRLGRRSSLGNSRFHGVVRPGSVDASRGREGFDRDPFLLVAGYCVAGRYSTFLHPGLHRVQGDGAIDASVTRAQVPFRRVPVRRFEVIIQLGHVESSPAKEFLSER